jgi:hypothetical protein
MSYAIRKDGQGWRAVNSAAEIDSATETFGVAQPPMPDTKWQDYQTKAQAALAKSDTTILRCAENAIAVPAAWATYRKALRAIVGATTPGDPTVPLPTQPTFPVGT